MIKRCVLLLLFTTATFSLVLTESEPTKEGDEEHDEEHHDHDEFNFLDFFGEDNTEDDLHLEAHLKEDIGIEKSVENMTEFEKDWYYFKLHDSNEDMTLDGLELFKAWQHHYLEHMGHEGLSHLDNSTEEAHKYIDTQNEIFTTMVDHILEEQDTDNNGYLDYFEFMLAKEKNRYLEKEKNEKQKKH